MVFVPNFTVLSEETLRTTIVFTDFGATSACLCTFGVTTWAEFDFTSDDGFDPDATVEEVADGFANIEVAPVAADPPITRIVPKAIGARNREGDFGATWRAGARRRPRVLIRSPKASRAGINVEEVCYYRNPK